MRIKCTFFEKEIIGIGIYRIIYETNIRMDDYPACGMLKDKLEPLILEKMGCTVEEAREDDAYSLDFIVRRKKDLGILLPGDNYSLVITAGKCIKRMERAFQIQGDF